MQSSSRQVFFLSNGTAITAETLGLSLLAQFPDHPFQTHTIPFVDTLEKAHAVTDEINHCVDATNQLPIVICTMGDEDLIKIIKQAKALVIDPFGDILPRLEKVLAVQHHEPGQSHRTVNPFLYDSRIDAIEYAMQHDDGGKNSPSVFAEGTVNASNYLRILPQRRKLHLARKASLNLSGL